MEELLISDSCIDEVASNHKFLLEFSKDKIIYGVNTGFGPMAQYIIPSKDLEQLQYNLIRSHASGTGNWISPEHARATLYARLISRCQAYSGVHPDTIKALTNFLNLKLTPCIPEHGGVGASGDLVQLAHLALNLIGEGNLLEEGKEVSVSTVFENKNVTPLKMHLREGLALINGTSAMTGIGLTNIIAAKKLLHWSLILCGFLNEITSAYDDHHSEALNGAKQHHTQSQIANYLRKILSDSKCTKERYEDLAKNGKQNGVLKNKLQEFYSIRCVPQVLGPIYKTILEAEITLINELNSANDNPIVDHKKGNVFHGGNFHGDYVSLEMDKLKIAITKLCMLVERQINFMLNEKINGKLPPFINLGTLGLNFGMQGMQFTATSTTAENQMLSNPMYVHSISTNNDNQDIVSMGTNSALISSRVIMNTFEVLSVGLLSATQAVDALEIQSNLSSTTAAIYQDIRKTHKKIVEDKPASESLKSMVAKLKELPYNKILNW